MGHVHLHDDDGGAEDDADREDDDVERAEGVGVDDERPDEAVDAGVGVAEVVVVVAVGGGDSAEEVASLF